MSCDSTRFEIAKGSDNAFVFTIKQDNSTLPLVIESSDTFFADLISLEDNEPYLAVTNLALTTVDINNGKVALNIPAASTVDLILERGAKVDRYYPRPTYKLLLRCSTVNNGDFTAKVEEVYVN